MKKEMKNEKSDLALSLKKQAFLTELKKRNDEPLLCALSVNDLISQKEHYKKKYDIDIIINGETSYGQDCIKKHPKSNLIYSEMVQEVKVIQNTLAEGEIRGYVYTCGAYGDKITHFEVLLIGKRFIFKPITWPNAFASDNKEVKSIASEDFPGTVFYDSNISVLNKGYSSTFAWPTPPMAQATTAECGALGLKYIVNFLKENRRQLREFSLKIPYYNSQQNLAYFFFPSPAVLYYSQSSTYNKAMASLLFQNTPEVTIDCVMEDSDHKPVKLPVPFKTIKGLLEESKKIALGKNAQDIYNASDEILKQLPEFRAKWKQEYTRYDTRRALMQVDGGDNRALLYAAMKYKQFLTADQSIIEAPAYFYTAQAVAYEKGVGGQINMPKAIKWYEKAAFLDDHEANFWLGEAYEFGKKTGINPNFSKALKYYVKAAELGSVFSQGRLGQFYLVGKGIEKDLTQAEHFLHLAALQGDIKAQCNLGQLHFMNNEIGKARDVLRPLVDQKPELGLAWHALGNCYFVGGDGVEVNLAAAKHCYKKAADLGIREAAADLKEGCLQKIQAQTTLPSFEKPNFKTAMQAAANLVKAKKLKMAIASYQAIVKQFPSAVPNNLVNLYYQLGDAQLQLAGHTNRALLEGALTHFEKAKQLSVKTLNTIENRIADCQARLKVLQSQKVPITEAKNTPEKLSLNAENPQGFFNATGYSSSGDRTAPRSIALTLPPSTITTARK